MTREEIIVQEAYEAQIQRLYATIIAAEADADTANTYQRVSKGMAENINARSIFLDLLKSMNLVENKNV